MHRCSMSATLWRQLLLISILLPQIGGCIAAKDRSPVPYESVELAEIDGMSHVRFWGDQIDPWLQKEFIRIAHEYPMSQDPLSEEGPGIGGMVLSGGGDAGAYGAGLLCGWSERGTRPRFRIVTGVSTGAMIAPFAFLGHRYDAQLRRIFTGIDGGDIRRKRWPIEWLWSDSLADSKPLVKLADRELTQKLIDDVAAEHAKGRRLYIQTVNLDAQRPVVWDMGAIASSRTPDAAKLFRQVVIASAAIPAAFPPQYIKVKASGKTCDEMHVDGGVASQMLMSNIPVDLAAVRKQVEPTPHRPRIYIIRNALVRPEGQQTKSMVVPIALRAIASMIKSQAHTELELMYYEAKAADIDYFLTHVPDSYRRTSGDPFDNAEMIRMFNTGYELALKGDPWVSEPPRLTPRRSLR